MQSNRPTEITIAVAVCAGWLEIVVGGQILAPRQALRPAPPAVGLHPGTSIVASDPGVQAFSVQHTATVIGKALGRLDDGKGTVPVPVTLQ